MFDIDCNRTYLGIWHIFSSYENNSLNSKTIRIESISQNDVKLCTITWACCVRTRQLSSLRCWQALSISPEIALHSSNSLICCGSAMICGTFCLKQMLYVHAAIVGADTATQDCLAQHGLVSNEPEKKPNPIHRSNIRLLVLLAWQQNEWMKRARRTILKRAVATVQRMMRHKNRKLNEAEAR